MQKVLGFFKKATQQSQPQPQSPQQNSSPYHLISNNNDNLSLSSVHQEQQQSSPSQEEIRRQRLARLDKQQQQQNVPQRGPSKDIANHPLTLEFGQNAYLVHTFLEDIYLNTFHKTSLSRNPELKLLHPQSQNDEIRLYTQENMSQDIMKFLQSETYYPSILDKLTFLHDIYGRVGSKTQEDLLSEEKIQSLRKIVLKSLTDYLSNSITIENPRVVSDLNNPLLDALYLKLSAITSNGYFHQFIRNLSEENYDAILTPLFKRMIRDTAENSDSKREKTLNAMTLLQQLANCNPKVVEFLFQHELHTPQNATGQEYQKNTVFGVFLSYNAMNNTSDELAKDIETAVTQDSKTNEVYLSHRQKIHQSIDAFQRLLESLIKLNPKYKRNILDWFNVVIKANESMHSISYNPEDHQNASKGWFCNFYVLLLKLCENMLKDPLKWISKIDLNYIHYNPIFENRLLMDGTTKLPPCSPEKHQELKESKFSFGTELIFAATYSWFLLRHSVQEFRQMSENLALLEKAKLAGNLDEASYLTSALEVSRPLARALIQLFDPYLLEQTHRLLNFQTLLILSAYGQNISSPQDISSSGFLFEQLQGAPSKFPILKYWLLNVTNYLDHFSNVTTDITSKVVADWDLLLNFLLSLAMNKFEMTSSDLKTLSLFVIQKLFETIMNNFLPQEISFILKTSPFYQLNLPQVLIDTFLDTKEIYQMPTPSDLHELTRFNLLITFHSLLESLFVDDLGSSYLIHYMKDLFKNNKQKYLRFMNTFMDDLDFLLNEISKKLLLKENEASLLRLENVIRIYNVLALNLSHACPELLLDENVRGKFVICLNSAIKVLNAEGFMDLVQKSEVSVNIDSQGIFLASLTKIYLNLADDDGFVQCLVNERGNCGIEYFYQVQYWLEGNEALSAHKEKFAELTATLELLAQSNL